VCLAFIPITRPYGLCDPLCILGETFLGLGRGLICRCSGVFVGQLWMNPRSKLPSVKKDVLYFNFLSISLSLHVCVFLKGILCESNMMTLSIVAVGASRRKKI
jgi:hypothetical protein